MTTVELGNLVPVALPDARLTAWLRFDPRQDEARWRAEIPAAGGRLHPQRELTAMARIGVALVVSDPAAYRTLIDGWDHYDRVQDEYEAAIKDAGFATVDARLGAAMASVDYDVLQHLQTFAEVYQPLAEALNENALFPVIAGEVATRMFLVALGTGDDIATARRVDAAAVRLSNGDYLAVWRAVTDVLQPSSTQQPLGDISA